MSEDLTSDVSVYDDELAESVAAERRVARRELVALAVVVAIVVLRIAYGI